MKLILQFGGFSELGQLWPCVPWDSDLRNTTLKSPAATNIHYRAVLSSERARHIKKQIEKEDKLVAVL
jgi:hypothetical protein